MGVSGRAKECNCEIWEIFGMPFLLNRNKMVRRVSRVTKEISSCHLRLIQERKEDESEVVKGGHSGAFGKMLSVRDEGIGSDAAKAILAWL